MKTLLGSLVVVFSITAEAGVRCQGNVVPEVLLAVSRVAAGQGNASSLSRQSAKKFILNSTDVNNLTCSSMKTSNREVSTVTAQTMGIDGGDAVWCDSTTTMKRIRRFMSEGYVDSYEVRFVGDCE